MKKTIFSLIATVCVAFALTSCGGAKPEKTIQNLKDAITGESNASAKYAAFAKKAQEEGYLNIAKLFEATSKAEQVHIDNHTKVLNKLGVTDFVAEITESVVGSTAENLQAGIDGETYEVTTMYPGFVETANLEGVNDATTSFGWAVEAEKKHAVLYAEALAALNSAAAVVAADSTATATATPATVAADSTGTTVAAAPAVDAAISGKWLVCPKCGDTYSAAAGATACNVCATAIDQFIVVE